MANDLVWNKIMLDEFPKLACLTDDETVVLLDWASGKSIVHTSMTHNMSTRKINNIRKSIREKYDSVQIYTPLLPVRNTRS